MTMQVAFSTLEAWVFGKKEPKNLEETFMSNSMEVSIVQGRNGAQTSDSSVYWKTNILRSMIVATTVLFVIYIADSLDKFISVAGSIFGMTNVLLLPAICHLRLVANTPGQRCFDIFIIVFATLVLIFGPATIIMQW